MSTTTKVKRRACCPSCSSTAVAFVIKSFSDWDFETQSWKEDMAGADASGFCDECEDDVDIVDQDGEPIEFKPGE